MASQTVDFRLYHRGKPPKITVWCTATFGHEVGKLFFGCSAAERVQFANINALINRFANGDQLSQASFRQEREGYAFRSGPLRFYGAFSNTFPGSFVLSHAIVKRHDKLTEADHARIVGCRQAFDAIATLPATPT